MKKLLILPMLLALAACNRPSSEAELKCDIDYDYKTYMEEGMTNSSKNKIPVIVNVKTYSDKAEVSIDKQTEIFTQIKNEEYEPGYYLLEYKGILPGTTKEAKLSMALDSKKHMIVQYDISFEKYNSGVGYYCEPVKQEYKGKEWSANVPFRK
ncbi:MAG: hypothetical protein IKP35_00770 [Alphaproteobacteria bacterium]|nr:hypothetical protein [Alphaproteobacteria bacterium]